MPAAVVTTGWQALSQDYGRLHSSWKSSLPASFWILSQKSTTGTPAGFPDAQGVYTWRSLCRAETSSIHQNSTALLPALEHRHTYAHRGRDPALGCRLHSLPRDERE